MKVDSDSKMDLFFVLVFKSYKEIFVVLYITGKLIKNRLKNRGYFLDMEKLKKYFLTIYRHFKLFVDLFRYNKNRIVV